MRSRNMVGVVALCWLVGCSSEGGQPIVDLPLEVTCADTLESVLGDPGEWDQQRGTIIRCAEDAPLSREELRQEMEGLGYRGSPLPSGARRYRVLYGTTRGNGEPGYSSAAVYVPDRPVAEEMPRVIVSHGSRGQAQKCAPSLLIPELDGLNEDQLRIVYTIVGAGLPVIAPDLAGYANFGATGNPPSVYNSAADVGQSTLDGAAVLGQLIPSHLTDDVIITGLSQGGHSALSAMALASTYGLEGTLAGVVAYAPLWISQRTWGGVLLVAGDYPLAEDPNPTAVSVWYHYTHGELLDGPGGGLLPFAPDKAAGIKRFVDGTCWGSPYAELEALGETAADLFSDEFQSAVAAAAALGLGCPSDEPAASTCQLWLDRYQQDRPHLTGPAASVPLLILYGGQDETIPPGRFQCVLDRLEDDGVNATHCYDPEAGHGDLSARTGEYVAQWILNRTLGRPLTVSCPSSEIALTTESGDAVTCQTPPPND